MIFKKKHYPIKWDIRNKKESTGSIVFQIFSMKIHEEGQGVHNNPAGSNYIPAAIQIEGELLKEEGVHLDKKKVVFLIPHTNLEESSSKFIPGDTVRLWLSDSRKCVKFEKLNRQA